MPLYLIQGSYSSAALAALIRKPQNRLRAVQAAVKKMGGSVEGGWLSFGEYDYAFVCRMPNNVSAAAFSLAVGAAGALKSNKTTPLFTFEEGIKAMRLAGKSSYRPPK
jgi:uncharacterized protein with GYD domain